MKSRCRNKHEYIQGQDPKGVELKGVGWAKKKSWNAGGHTLVYRQMVNRLDSGGFTCINSPTSPLELSKKNSTVNSSLTH